MSRKRQIGVVVLFLMVVAATAGGILYQQQRFKHFAVHEPGMVYRSAWLAPDVLSELIAKYQIRSVVNLCNPTEMTPQQWEGERHAVEGSGAVLHTVPLPEQIEFDPQVWSQHLKILADPNNYPMLVHCQHGVTRTGMLLTAYDVIYRQMSAEESLDAQPTFGHGRANVHVRAFGKNFEQYVKKNPERFASTPLAPLH